MLINEIISILVNSLTFVIFSFQDTELIHEMGIQTTDKIADKLNIFDYLCLHNLRIVWGNSGKIFKHLGNSIFFVINKFYHALSSHTAQKEIVETLQKPL